VVDLAAGRANAFHSHMNENCAPYFGKWMAPQKLSLSRRK
jgi:hypothetical protein